MPIKNVGMGGNRVYHQLKYAHFKLSSPDLTIYTKTILHCGNKRNNVIWYILCSSFPWPNKLITQFILLSAYEPSMVRDYLNNFTLTQCSKEGNNMRIDSISL